jgi:hypothetical protein
LADFFWARADFTVVACEEEDLGLAARFFGELALPLGISAGLASLVFDESTFTLAGFEEAPAVLALAPAFPTADFLDGVCLATPTPRPALRDECKLLSRKKKQTR